MLIHQLPDKLLFVTIILGSSSVYRRRQLAQLVCVDRCISPNIAEDHYTTETQQERADRLSRAKAAAVFAQLSGLEQTDAVVIAGDQTATCKGSILDKPGTVARAERQLQILSGNTASFYSGVAVVFQNDDGALQTLSRVVETRVKVRKLSSLQIDGYLEREEVLDCAGSFKCEGLGIALFDSISSDDPSALVGLPLIATRMLLENAGIVVI